MIIDRYRASDASGWDTFVRASRNGTFQFLRAYMEYHRHRFSDHSLVLRDPEGDIVALLPAHAAGDRLSSHAGLSFGGLVVGPGMKAPLLLRCFEALLWELMHLGFAALDYKTVPHIYHRQPAEEDRYALFLVGAKVIRRDLLAVIGCDDRIPFQTRRARGVKKARGAGVIVHEEGDFGDYWKLLASTLAERFEAEPVHSLDEMRLLKNCFPTDIRLFTARSATGEILAGVVVYESARVAHAQYIAASPTGRDVAALDILFDHLLNSVYQNIPYFDFGSSHEQAGRTINVGLIDQKEGFGARAVAHDHYCIDLTAVRPGMLTEALR